MVRKIQTRAGHVGYRNQLDRARRFLERAERSTNEDDDPMTDVEFQDMMWAFFQNCWHVKDWVVNDPVMDQPKKDAVCARAHASTALLVCRDMCNGTKHLGARSGAAHDHIDTTIVPGVETIMDCLIDRGDGVLVSGRALAHQCIGEWCGILESNGLATARLS
jgi:hypothetical protein